MLTLLLMAIFILSYYFTTKKERIEKSKALESEILRRCPPHKWEFLEQPGLEGVTYIKCKFCDMIPGEK